MADETFAIQPAVRQRVPLLLGIVGPSGSGKTWSALRLATGIQRVAGGDIAVIDTEARRALHYADRFKFHHLPLTPPFGSLRYLAAIRACVQHGAGVVVIDTASLEHEGEGGMLDLHEQELTRMAGSDYAKRERCKMLAWSKPKAARRAFLSGLLQLNCNFIFSFRAKTVSKPVKKDGKTEVVEMGFVPISGDELVYEMTANIFLPPKAGGIPCWQSDYPGERMAMKIPEQFRGIFAKPQPLSEDVGQMLAEWAAGGAPDPAAELFAAYERCATADGWKVLETRRATIWQAIKPADRRSLKAASDAAKLRLVEQPEPQPEPQPDPDQDDPADPSTQEPTDLFDNGGAAELPD